MGWNERQEVGLFRDGGDASQRRGRQLWKGVSLASSGVDDRAEALSHVRVAEHNLVSLTRSDQARYTLEGVVCEDSLASPRTTPRDLAFRMYEDSLPAVGDSVMIQYEQITDTGVMVSLLEYGGISGNIVPSEVSSSRRPPSLASLVRARRKQPALVIGVDREKGYVDLSARKMAEQAACACKERYIKSKTVHLILGNIATKLKLDLEGLYHQVGWPLYRAFGHAFTAFELIRSDPDTILDALTYEKVEMGPDGIQVVSLTPSVTAELKDELVKNIKKTMDQQPSVIRAYVELTCFEFDGFFHIKEAMRAAEACGTVSCPVKMKLIAAPLYTLTTKSFDKNVGLEVISRAISACSNAIASHRGEVVVKVPPGVVNGGDGP